MDKPQYLGVRVFMGGMDYIVPSLSVKQFREYYDTLAKPTEGEGKAAVEVRFDTYLPIIHAALIRNYPDLTFADFEEMVDLHTFQLLIRAVQNASGMKVVKPGEADPQTAP